MDWFYYFARSLIGLLVRLWYGLEVHGADNFPRQGAVLLVSNHISAFDPLLIGIASPRKVSLMAKKELFERWWLRLLIRGLYAFPVDRQGNATAAIKESLRRLQAGGCVGIFVQGTRSANHSDALDGAAFIAQRSGAQVQPMAIWREGRRFHVCFGEPFSPPKDRQQLKSLTETIILRIAALLPPAAT